jgi:hypothetical protein
MNNISLSEPKKFKEFELLFNPEKILSESFNPISKILFLIRNNISYQLKLIEYAEEKGDDYVKDNLVNFFSNRFYENILIQNAENEEFLILLFYLFENEINNMYNASLSEFLDEQKKFIGKLLLTYICKMEFKNFLRVNLNEFIMNIHNFHSNSTIDLELKLIFDYCKKMKIKLDEKKTEIFGKNALNRTISMSIKKTTNTSISNIPNNKNSNENINRNSSNNQNVDNHIFDNEILGKAIKKSLLITGVYLLFFIL